MTTKTMTYTNLAKFRYANRKTVAALPGMKSIMLVQTKRQIAFYLVLPALGDNDARCILLEKHDLQAHDCTYWKQVQERIIAEETTRAAARLS